MDFLTKILADLYETFKAKNPRTAAFVALALGAVIYFAQQGSFLGLFALPDLWAGVVQFISTVFLAVSGSQTFPYLSPTQKSNR